MTVSIVIPVYNVSPYIERCLNSVISQQYKHLECILVDDASPDDSMVKATKMISGYAGPISFKTIRHETNKGLSAARNSGIMESSGEYLYFLDGDDALLDSSISSMMNLVVRYGNPDFVQGSTLIFGGSDRKQRYLISKKVPEFINDRIWIRKNMLERKKIPVTAWNKLIRKDFLVNNQLFYKVGIWHEDELWTFIAGSKVKTVAFNHRPGYQHFINSGSIMTTSGQRSIDSWFLILEEIVSSQSLDHRPERITILEMLFCQLVRILESDESKFESNLKRLVKIVQVCRSSSLKRSQKTEMALLSCYRWKHGWLNIFRYKWVRSIYFRLLKWFV